MAAAEPVVAAAEPVMAAAEPILTAKAKLEMLNSRIQDILTANPRGLVAKEIMHKLRDLDGAVMYSKSDVNKLLYKGPFMKKDAPADGKSKAPTWVSLLAPPALACTGLPSKPGHFAFRIEDVGVFYLNEGHDAAQIRSFLTYIADTVPSWKSTAVRHDDTPCSRLFAVIAVDLGFLDVKSEL